MILCDAAAQSLFSVNLERPAPRLSAKKRRDFHVDLVHARTTVQVFVPKYNNVVFCGVCVFRFRVWKSYQNYRRSGYGYVKSYRIDRSSGYVDECCTRTRTCSRVLCHRRTELTEIPGPGMNVTHRSSGCGYDCLTEVPGTSTCMQVLQNSQKFGVGIRTL